LNRLEWTGGPLLIATRSEGKLRELRPIFASAGIPVLGLEEAGVGYDPAEEEIESANTFEENALAKARWFALRTGLAAVADDSGLEVEALAGAPGVRSKRWSGRTDLAGAELDAANNACLVKAMHGIVNRRARYVCVAALVDGAGERSRRGETAGLILDSPRGAGGFGYDPYFLSDQLGRTFGEASVGEKEAVSHRGRAFAALLASFSAER
jgi:XTP/dITP diphosphohydrolase